MYHIFIHSSVYEHVCFHRVLDTVNSAVVNISVHVSFWTIVLSGYMARSRIAGSYGNSIFSFKKLKTELPYYTAIWFLDIYLEKTIDRWMGNEDVVYTYNGILLRHKKGYNSFIFSNIGWPRDYYIK